MSHMDYGDDGGTSCADSGCGSRRFVEYTAVGGEADWFVPIGTTLAADDYRVTLFGTAGVAVVPQLDFPNAAPTDRTDTQFRVQAALALTAGDVLIFEIVES